MYFEGHVVAEDEIAGLRVGEAHLSQVSSDEGPDVGACREHRAVCTLGRQGHDEHAFHRRCSPVGVGGLDHEAKVGEAWTLLRGSPTRTRSPAASRC